MSKTYAADGVNTVAGDDISAFAAELCERSQAFSSQVVVRDFSRGHFRGPRGFRLRGLPRGCFYDLAPDGIGTKSILTVGSKTPLDSGRDLLAMVCMDITRWGGLPLMATNILDVRSLGTPHSDVDRFFRDLLQGLLEAAQEYGVVLHKGETAELSTCIGSDITDGPIAFNWGGVAFGAYHPKKMITGERVRDGDVVVALKERSFRSNGLSSVRKALRMRFGEEWWNSHDAADAVAAAAMPSVCYDRFLAEVQGWFNPPTFEPLMPVHLIVHCTGGAIRSKFAEDILFPRGLSAELNDLWDPPSIMQYCAQWRKMTNEECYETWNGGQGALVVLREADAHDFCLLAKKHRVEAKRCGYILTREKPTVRINSRFSDEWFTYTST